MRRLIFMVLLTFIFLVGCSDDETYNNAIERGLDYIAAEEYEKAESAFEFALDERENDSKATTLLEQTVNYQASLSAFNDADLEMAKEKAEKVTNLTDGSRSLIKKSEEIISLINEMEEILLDVTNEYEKALKHLEDKEYNDATEVIEEILKKDLDHQIYKQAKKDIKTLQNKIDEGMESEKQASTEKTSEKEAEKTTNPISETKEIYNLNGYDVYDEDGMTFDAHTGEPVLHNHPIYDDYNVNSALEWAYELYETGMSKDELVQTLYFNVEVSEEDIVKAVDIFWAENF